MDGLDSIGKALLGLGSAGPFLAFLLYLWRDERAERRETSKENTQLLRDKITSDNALASALNKIADKVGA